MQEMQGPQWDEWKAHPQTKEFIKLLNQQFEATERQWSNRDFYDDDPHKAAMLNAKALGGQLALSQIITALEEQVITVLETPE